MNSSKSIILPIFLLIALSSTYASAATFNILNNCPFTIWAAAYPGGGRQLDTDQTWRISVPNNITNGRIWARTGCFFDATGRGRCRTGDCNGQLQCQGYGTPPNTLAEYALRPTNSNLVFFDISLVDGFNVPMEFSPISGGCNWALRCMEDINEQCPIQLRAPGGCNGPCPVFRTNVFCCDSGNCGPTAFSRFFKDRCPHAYSYPLDDQTSTFTCPVGNIIRVIFCP